MSVEYDIRIPDEKYDVEAGVVSSWTRGEHMLPKSTDDILDLFKNGHSVLIYKLGHRNPPLAHAAITAEYSDDHIEIGTLITSPDMRKRGIGSIATLAVIQLAEDLFPGYGKFALANNKSAQLFEKLGAKPMSTIELCAEVWEFCSTCPNLPKQVDGGVFKCCDTPYDLTGIGYLANMYTVSWLSKYIWRAGYVPPHR